MEDGITVEMETQLGEELLERLRTRVAQSVSRVCPAWLAAEADDIVQVAMIKVMRELARREGNTVPPSSYLMKVAYNATVDEIRRRRRMGETPLEDATELMTHRAADNPERQAEARRIASGVTECLSGHLPDDRPSESDLALVFSIMERRRARMLLDQLDAARAVTVRASVAPATPSFPSLRELRAAMGPHEAVLGFQISARGQDPPLGGSWLLVHTRTETRVYEMPDPTELDTSVSLFNGLIARRDGSERAGAQRLYTLLLQRAIANLPAAVRHLIVVPDAMLFNVPFPALQDASGEPIGARYEMSIVPSATAWLTWRRRPGDARPSTALAFADPAMTIASGDRSDPRLRDAARSGPLPQARREAAAVRRSFAEATVRLGTDASEQFIKSADLRHISLVHIAAHGLRGQPGAAWAGIVTLGNGDVVPIPGGLARTPLRAALLIALAGVSLLALLLLLRTRLLRR